MEDTFQASTVVMDKTGYDELQDQILNRKSEKSQTSNSENAPEKKKEVPPSSSKKYVFKKGDQSLELDDDFELEFMADKRPTKLTLRELKDRAAGDIAVKSRMHALAEERKQVQSTFKQFAALAKNDPLAALEFISNKAREADSEFEYNQYIQKLGEQAEKLGQMDEKERKNWELEKKLNKANEDLSLKERQEIVVKRQHEILDTYPEIGDSTFRSMVDAVLDNEDLSEGLENENDVMDQVERLIQETLTQRDIVSLIQNIDPSQVHNEDLIFSLSNQILQNPDLDEEDIRDILQEVLAPKQMATLPSKGNAQREKDSRVLSDKARQSTSQSTKGLSNYELLEKQLREKKEVIHRTPLHKR